MRAGRATRNGKQTHLFYAKEPAIEILTSVGRIQFNCRKKRRTIETRVKKPTNCENLEEKWQKIA